jgi:transposase
MEKAKEILRLSGSGMTQREIAGAMGCSLGTVHMVLAKVKQAGILDPVALNSKELGSLLYPPSKGVKKEIEPDLEYIHREMQKKGVTLTLLWEEYKIANPGGLMLSQFCERYRRFRKQNEVYLRKSYKAGERMLVDWAGLTMRYTGRQAEAVKVYLFVADLPASSYLYVEPFSDMGQESWIQAHINAFGYYGGVPRLLVPDNTKTAVIKARYYDPELNKTYHELAVHYGAAIVPARSRKPTDKAPVETGVQIVERRIIAKLRDRQFFSLSEVREAVKAELELLNTQAFSKLPGNRRQAFMENEKGSLKPLPEGKYEYAQWKEAKAAFDYHIQFDSFFYSIPYTFAGKIVHIRATARAIEVFSGGERIAAHIRNYDTRHRYTTSFEHMPEKHKAVADWTPERFLSWAAKTGEKTKAYIASLMESREHPEQAFKTCAGILRLGETVSSEAMEAICCMAVERHVYTYKYFDLLLKQEAPGESPPIAHTNVRGKEYYRNAGQAPAGEALHA